MIATTNFASSQPKSDTQVTSVAGEPALLNGHGDGDTQGPIAVEEPTSPPTPIVRPIPSETAASGPDLQGGQSTSDTQAASAFLDQATPTPISLTLPKRQSASGGPDLQEGHANVDTQPESAFLDHPLLGVLAETVDDLEKVRIANENRLRQLTDTSERGHGLTLHNPDVARLAALCDSLKTAEHQAILNMNRVMRAHPLWDWAKPVKGVGEKQFARLLAVIGDPYWNDLHDRPRLVSELWAFCGYHVLHLVADHCDSNTQKGAVSDGVTQSSGGHFPHDTQGAVAAGQTSSGQQVRDNHSPSAAGLDSHPSGQAGRDNHSPFAAGVAPKRTRGQCSNWNEDARKRCYLIAESLMKQQSVYRDVYDQIRAKYANAVHAHPCVRCGPKGKPAQPGSQLSLGHRHARALRAVAKEFLKHLWREAKRLHENLPTTTEPEN